MKTDLKKLEIEITNILKELKSYGAAASMMRRAEDMTLAIKFVEKKREKK